LGVTYKSPNNRTKHGPNQTIQSLFGDRPVPEVPVRLGPSFGHYVKKVVRDRFGNCSARLQPWRGWTIANRILEESQLIEGLKAEYQDRRDKHEREWIRNVENDKVSQDELSENEDNDDVV
jgi:hypothetical protein